MVLQCCDSIQLGSVLCLHYLSLSNLAGELSKSKAKISEHANQVRDVLLAVKGSTVESGLLHLTTDLRPRDVNTCKWTEKASTTRTFVRLFDDLTELTVNENSKIDFDTRRAFKVKSDHYSKQWDAFAQLHGMLQEDGLARNKGQKMIDMLHETIALYREKQGHQFKGCELKNDHSKLGNKHENDHAFSRAVDKIQNKKENELTNHEKDSCKSLLKKNHLNWAGIEDNQDEDDDYSSEEELYTQESTFSMKSVYSQESKKAEAEE